MMWIPTIILFAVYCGDPIPAASGAAAEPFSMASSAPADVSLMLHVEQAAQMRRELSDRPIAEWVAALSQSSEAVQLWEQLAGHVDLPPERLFDLCLGSRVTLVARSMDEWALLTDIPKDHVPHLLRKLDAIARGPRFGMAMYELPEHDLLIAHARQAGAAADRVVIGSRTRTDLFEQVLSRLEKPLEGSLAGSEAIRTAAELGPGHVGLFVAHEPPLGGWSVMVASLSGEQLSIRHRGQFEHAPFARSRAKTMVDGSLLASFEDHALLAIIEPTEVGGGQLEAFLRASIGRDVLSGPMRRNLEKRRIIVVGEIEGRQEPKPLDIQATTLAVCLQLKDAALAEGQLDRQMVTLAKRLDELGGAAFEIAMPKEAFKPGQPRTIDVSPAAVWLAGSLPLAQPVTLNWVVIRDDDAGGGEHATARGDGEKHGDGGGWAVLATHPQQLHDSVRALRKMKSGASQQAAHSCGFASGSRIGQHLLSWSERPELFASADDATQLQAVGRSLKVMSKLASGFECARWRLNRPSENEMCLEVTLKLSAPESARE